MADRRQTNSVHSSVEQIACPVAAEFVRLEADKEAEEVEAPSATLKWLEARVRMLWATAVHRGKIELIDRELSRIEPKLAAEPAPQVKAAIIEEIELIRALLLAQ
jgi:hypothetical protein